MSLANLQRQVLAERDRILAEIEEEHRERNAAATAALAAAAAAAKADKEAAKAAERARIEARKAERAAAKAARNAARGPTPTRRRAAGANYVIAGRPAHLAPGAKLRSTEKKRNNRNVVTYRQTRGRLRAGKGSRSARR